MRLLIQRCLIPWLLLLLALPVAGETIPADGGMGDASQGWQIYSTTRKCGASPIDTSKSQAFDMYENAHGCAARDEGQLTSYWLPRCQTDYGRCEIRIYQDIRPYQSGFYLGEPQFTTRYFEAIYYYNGPNNPEACAEQGLNYDPFADEGAECIKYCSHGSFNGICLGKPDEPEEECTPDSPDYRGEIVLGYGKPPTAMCGDYDQCTGTGGSVGFFNGELKCLSDDYGAPTCEGGSISVIDEYGFVCEPLQNQPEEPQTPEQPNTDTDGDGVPDEYQEKNDPESVDKGLDDVKDAINQGNDKTDKSNQHLSNIENALEGMAGDLGALKQMGESGELGGGGGSGGDGAGLVNDQGEDYLGDLADIKQNTRDSADVLQAFEQANESPEGGFDSSELNSIVPTFAETGAQFKAAIMNFPIAQSFQDFANIPENNVCPIYTLPATPISGQIDMDIHCRVISEYGALIQAMFMFFWVGLAFFIFFKA